MIEALVGDRSVASFDNESAYRDFLKAYAPEVEKLWLRLVEIRDEIREGMAQEAARCGICMEVDDPAADCPSLTRAVDEIGDEWWTFYGEQGLDVARRVVGVR